MSIDIIYETEILGRSVSLNSRRTDTAELIRQARHSRAEVLGSVLGSLVADSVLKLGTSLKKVAYTVEAWRQRRATFGELNALDDRLLSDIGISRSDIPTIAEASGHRTGVGGRGASSASLLTRSL